MSETLAAIPATHTGFVPQLTCSPCPAAIEFYVKAFSAEKTAELLIPGTDKVMHAELIIGTGRVMLSDEFSEHCPSRSPQTLGGTAVTLFRYVENCDAAFDQAVKAGAEVVMPPEDMFWGDRYAVVKDPFGHMWSFGQHLRDVDPSEYAEAMKNMPPMG